MSVVRWKRKQATGPMDPLAVDELAGHLLVLDGVTAADDHDLGWVRRAPCVVVGAVPAGAEVAASVDVAVAPGEDDVIEHLAARVAERPHASRVLVEVLRVTPGLDVAAGLVVESLAYSVLLAGSEFAAWLGKQPSRGVRAFAGDPVRLARTGSELRITLARPENRNAFSAAMRDALFEALTFAAIDDSIERIVLDAVGPVFSSGGDLAEFGTALDVVSAHDVRSRRSVGALLDRLRSRTTVHVQGACVGGGVELPAFAGRVIARSDATFRLPEVAMGLIPGAGGTVSITRRIGRQRTTRLALLGEEIGVGEALRIGLVDEISS